MTNTAIPNKAITPNTRPKRNILPIQRSLVVSCFRAHRAAAMIEILIGSDGSGRRAVL
jgi:hypothetical protein